MGLHTPLGSFKYLDSIFKKLFTMPAEPFASGTLNIPKTKEKSDFSNFHTVSEKPGDLEWNLKYSEHKAWEYKLAPFDWDH